MRYYLRADAENAMRYVNGTRLDDRIVRTDFDAGFKEGRQYGRGKSGGQVCLVMMDVLGGGPYAQVVGIMYCIRPNRCPGRLRKFVLYQ